MCQGEWGISLYSVIRPPRFNHANIVHLVDDCLSFCILLCISLAISKGSLQVKERTRISHFIYPPFFVLRYLIMDIHEEGVCRHSPHLLISSRSPPANLMAMARQAQSEWVPTLPSIILFVARSSMRTTRLTARQIFISVTLPLPMWSQYVEMMVSRLA